VVVVMVVVVVEIMVMVVEMMMMMVVVGVHMLHSLSAACCNHSQSLCLYPADC